MSGAVTEDRKDGFLRCVDRELIDELRRFARGKANDEQPMRSSRMGSQNESCCRAVRMQELPAAGRRILRT